MTPSVLRRLDRVGWNRAHTAIATALGIGWPIGTVAMLPWCYFDIEGKGASLEGIAR